MTSSQSLKRALLNILDRAIVEMETRFSRSNLDLMKAVNCLLPQSLSFLDVAMLSPLQRLTGSACNDRLVVKLEKKFISAVADLSTICKYLQGKNEVLGSKLNTLWAYVLVDSTFLDNIKQCTLHLTVLKNTHRVPQ